MVRRGKDRSGVPTLWKTGHDPAPIVLARVVGISAVDMSFSQRHCLRCVDLDSRGGHSKEEPASARPVQASEQFWPTGFSDLGSISLGSSSSRLH